MKVSEQLIDPFGRVHDYLRISVTDRCNLRCVYCMPEKGLDFKPDSQLLSNEEIVEVVRVLADTGVTKLRFTGGEPLIRKDFELLISQCSSIPNIRDIALTTNGLLFAKKAKALKEAGLNRVNISLDSLLPDRFAKITRGGDLSKVMESIEAALAYGFDPVKINVVLMKGWNDDEVEALLQLTVNRKLHIRFIEYMPIGPTHDGWRDSYLSLDTVLERCTAAGWDYEPIQAVDGNGPAQYYQIKGAQGQFGLIHPVSDHFCETCNRLRLTADGNIKPCLFWNDEFHVRKWIDNDKKIKEIFQKALGTKPKNHEMAHILNKEKISHTPAVRHMSQIGG